MPDLQTALSSVAKQINFDDEPTSKPEPKNFAQKLFYWFVDNPASTAREAKDALGVESDGPVSGRIYQMYSKGILSRIDAGGSYRYTATCTEYPEFTIEDRREMMKKAIAVRKSKAKATRVAKKKASSLPKTRPPMVLTDHKPSLNPNPDAAQIVNSMSVGLAKAVYMELKKVFEA